MQPNSVDPLEVAHADGEQVAMQNQSACWPRRQRPKVHVEADRAGAAPTRTQRRRETGAGVVPEGEAAARPSG
eukprot:15471623-Alexandrium_andersonii.AAC.1